MNYEQKYKEALERARDLHDNHPLGQPQTWMTCEKIFPELKESEDEKIRKEIISFLKEGKPYYCPNSAKRQEWAAWLEKQGEQKPEEWCFPYNVNETVDKLMAIAECLEMDEDFLYNGYTGTECVKFLRDLARKQVECTPTDEIKPKFKVGDWIVQKNIGVYKVIEICKSWYEVIDFEENHYSISFDDEHMCHLWTIEDAKDGDVLALDWKDEWYWQKIVIFKSFNECGIEGYGNTFKNNKLAFVEDVPYYSKTWSKYLHPATKEQRDLLFQKMKEAGCEYDKVLPNES